MDGQFRFAPDDGRRPGGRKARPFAGHPTLVGAPTPFRTTRTFA
jgi:hypothetical protein